jgi:transposase
MGKRRVFSREFKNEAVRLVLERGVKVSQTSKDLGIHENVLRKWIRDVQADPDQSFPGRGRMKPDDAEVARLRRELAKSKAECDILKKAIASFARDRR